MDVPWRIDMLGGLRAHQPDREISRFQTVKTGALLAFLACHLRRPHTREELIALLWPDSTLEQGRPSLSVALSSLRHQLEPPGVSAGAVLTANRLSVQLNPGTCVTDIALFESAIERAGQVESADDKARLLAEAVELYRGDLLPGHYDDWCLTERRRLADLCCQALRDLVRLSAKAGGLTRALHYAQRAISVDPLREELQADLMRLYTAAKQPAAALRQYREFERRLKEELGWTPSEALKRLALEIEAQTVQGPEYPPAETRPIAAPVVAPPVVSAPTCPAGTVTLLAARIADVRAARHRLGDAFATARAAHVEWQRRTFEHHDGFEVKETADGLVILFSRASDAVAAALAAQRALAAHALPDSEEPLHVKMAIHTGEIGTSGKPLRPSRDLRGPVLMHVEQALSAGHGGQILCTQETAALVRRHVEPGFRLVDLGLYRLVSDRESERLFEVWYPDRPQTAFPPLAAPIGPLGSLPLQFSRFFGRDAELSRLVQLLHPMQEGGPDPALETTTSSGHFDARLVTLTGPGGAGKTRLAIEAAGRLREAFQGSVWFVPLAEVTRPEGILEAIIEALRLPPILEEEPMEQVVKALFAQPTLLVLDNYEQLLTEEDGAAERSIQPVIELLERLPVLRCLATSRRLLGLAAEREFPVPALPVPEQALGIGATPGMGISPQEPQTLAKHQPPLLTPNAQRLTPEALLSFPSVQLFINRAQVVKPDFQITPANAEAVAALCARLEGIPLALELAAARAQVLTPVQMLARLANRFEFLAGTRKDIASRHRTLRGAVDWSYQLLTPELQRFFAQLSVFRGGWTLEAAEAVCEEPLALDYLAQLRECSLIMTDDSAGDSDTIRFRMLETLREYSQEQRVAAGQADRIQQRHQQWFLALATEVTVTTSQSDQAARLERLERERDNFTAALAGLLARNAVADAARMCSVLSRFWERRGRLREGRAALLRCVARRQEIGDLKRRAELLCETGWFAHLLGDSDSAIPYLQESLGLYEQSGEDEGLSGALNSLAVTLQERGQLEESRNLFERSLVIARRLGDRKKQALRLSNLGRLAIQERRYSEGREQLEESRSLFESLRDPLGSAACLCNLADLALRRQDWTEAHVLSEQCLRRFQELGDQRGIALTLANLAEAATRCGAYGEAETHIHAALSICDGMGIHWLAPILLETRARILAVRGTAALGLSALVSAERLRDWMGLSRTEDEQQEFDVVAARLAAQLEEIEARKIRADLAARSGEEILAFVFKGGL